VTNQQIIIIGFMGAGKTTVARELGRKLNCLAVDLDELITRREGRSLNEIIEPDGEERFRELETQMLREVLREGPRVIAVGGGAWTISANRQLIAEHEAVSLCAGRGLRLALRCGRSRVHARRPNGFLAIAGLSTN